MKGIQPARSMRNIPMVKSRSKNHPSNTPLQVVWFKRDLRVADNTALSAAAARGPVLPLFIAEPGLYTQPDASARHWAFAAECLNELRQELAHLGQPLVIRIGDALQILQRLQATHGIGALWSHQETGNAWTFERDLRIKRWCRDHGVEWHEPRSFGVFRALRQRDGWAARWDKEMAQPLETPPTAVAPLTGIEPGPIPTTADLGLDADPCPQRQTGGRRAALELRETFFAERGRTYRRDMSSPVTAFAACSRLSPHLAWGTLSIRELTQATYDQIRSLKAVEQTDSVRAFRASLKSFSGRLHWHCHFIQKLESEPRIEFENLHPAYNGLRPDIANPTHLDAWANGQTGLPFVDACMRALIETGWLNFRMRAMLMAFASYHLWLPWRPTGQHLARMFTDYEPGIHWPQTQMQAGTTGINTVRIYNPIKQSRDQDPTGVFIRRYCPELDCVPDDYIHQPWIWPGFASEVAGAYPAPIVDHLKAAREARDRIWSVRNSEPYRQNANAIQSKHGSRKSGMKNTGQRPKRAQTVTTLKKQLSLDL